VDAEDRAEWRRRTGVADPHQRDLQPEWETERDLYTATTKIKLDVVHSTA